MRILKLSVFLLILILTSSNNFDSPPYYEYYTPVLVHREVLEKSIKYTEPHEMKNPGKIYLKDQYFYIVEKYKGIHVVDNSDRLNPVRKGFIQIPGCMDLAIKGNTLYADNAVDLVAISIAQEGIVQETSRIKESFPELTPPYMDYIPTEYSKENRPEGTIIIAWEIKRSY